MFETWTLKRKLTMTFAAILLLAGSLIVIAVFNFAKMRDTTGWNTHTYKVLAEGQGMLLNMVNIETGLRGFVASGDDKFLEPLQLGQAKFKENFENAKRLTSDYAAQQGRLDKMQAYHTQFVQIANGLIQSRRDGMHNHGE